MALESKSKEIKGDTYTVAQFKASKALRTLVELSKIAGPSIAILVEDDKKGDKKAPLSKDLIGKAMVALTDRLDTSSVESLVNTMAASTTIQVGNAGKPQALLGVWELHFAGSDLPKLFEWLRFALEVHFKDFFDYLAESGRAALDAEEALTEKAE